MRISDRFEGPFRMRYVVAGFSPRPLRAQEKSVRVRTRAKARDYTLAPELFIIVACLVLYSSLIGSGQARQSEAQKMDELIAMVQQGQFTPAILNQIARARAVEAIPGVNCP